MKQNNKTELKFIRKCLRSNGTSAEGALWNALKNKQLDGWRWRRQFSVGNIVIDFYCPKAKLGIELDGNYHFEAGGMIADEIKSELLGESGITVLHVENKLFWEMPERVLDYIKQELDKRKEVLG